MYLTTIFFQPQNSGSQNTAGAFICKVALRRPVMFATASSVRDIFRFLRIAISAMRAPIHPQTRTIRVRAVFAGHDYPPVSLEMSAASQHCCRFIAAIGAAIFFRPAFSTWLPRIFPGLCSIQALNRCNSQGGGLYQVATRICGFPPFFSPRPICRP